MNLPNRITSLRLFLTPVVFLWFFSIDVIKDLSPVLYTIVLLLIYGVMELSDLVDGKIARKRNLVTDLGKVLDPFADVIGHITFFTCLLVCNLMPVWAFMPILWRELGQSFMRMLLMGKGKAMPANIFGKSKTCLYAFASLLGLSTRIISVFATIPVIITIAMTVSCALAAIASVLSFLIYISETVKSGVLRKMTR